MLFIKEFEHVKDSNYTTIPGYCVRKFKPGISYFTFVKPYN